MDLFTNSLYANSSYAKTISHWLGFSLLKILNKFPSLLFTTSISAKFYNSLDPILFHSILQKWPKDLVSPYEVMVLSKPWNLTTFFKNKKTTSIASLIIFPVMKCTIFKNQYTKTITESCFLCVLGIPKKNSMLTSSQDLSGTNNGVDKLVFWLLPFTS